MDDAIRDSGSIRGVLMRCPQGDSYHYKNKELNEFDTMKYLKQPDGISYDVYNIEVIIAVAFRICSKESILFRQCIINKMRATKATSIITLFVSCGRGDNRWYS